MAQLERDEIAGICEDSELDILLADVLSRIDRSEAVNIDEVIASHPRHAVELRDFFSVSNELGEIVGRFAASGVRSAIARSIIDQAQRSTTTIDSQTVPLLSALPCEEVTAPRRIGKYEVRDLLGAGSFGRVYLGYDPLAKRQVAIKIPQTWAEVTQEQRDAFLHEAQSAAALRHENIVTLLDVYQGDDLPIALIYEHIPGPSLQAVLKQQDFERTEAMLWIAELAASLDYAHRRNVVHRDVKPSNILLTEQNGRRQPRMVDFGLALLHNQFWHKSERCRVGAIRYMSPEQARGNSHWATAQSDIFSLGVILYEVLCGRSPWSGTTDGEMLREIEQRDPVPPRVIDNTISPELERICLKALAKTSAERYTTAADMARDLQAAISDPTTGWRPVAEAATTIGVGKWEFSLRFALRVAAVVAPILLLAALGVATMRTEAPLPMVAAPDVPVVEPIEPQEVRLDLRVQPLGKPGNAIVLDEETAHLDPNDRIQINAEVPRAGYLYVAWYRPDGEVRLLDENALTTARIAVQEPPVNENTPWERLGTGGGSQLIVAFTKPTALTAEEAEQLKQAQWHSSRDWLGDRTAFRTGFPRVTSDEGGIRGSNAPAPQPRIDDDKYLGELGMMLKYEWKCYYQAIIFRVR